MNRGQLRGAALLALSVVAVAGIIGCGSGGDSTTAKLEKSLAKVVAVPNLTKAALIKRGDAICEKTDEVQESNLKAYLKKDPEAQSTPAGQRKMVVVAGIPPIQTEAEELAALGAPPGEEDEVTAIIRSIERALITAEEDPETLIGNGKNPFAGANELAGEYGFQACDKAL